MAFIATEETPVREYFAIKSRAISTRSMLEKYKHRIETIGIDLDGLNSLYAELRDAMLNVKKLSRTPKIEGVATDVEGRYNFTAEVLDLIAQLRNVMTWIERNTPETVKVRPATQWKASPQIDYTMTAEEAEPLCLLLEDVAKQIV